MKKKVLLVNLHHVRNFVDLPKVTDIEPARKPSQEEPSLPTPNFQL